MAAGPAQRQRRIAAPVEEQQRLLAAAKRFVRIASTQQLATASAAREGLLARMSMMLVSGSSAAPWRGR